MVIKVYTSGISGNKEVKKRQQRIMMILESKNIEYVAIDITEPGNEEEKHFMQENAEARDSKHPLPPQIFNEQDYCGDYTGFDLANENDELEIFLKMPIPPRPVVNGQHSTEKDGDQQVPERNEDIINSMVPDTTTTDGPTNKPEEESVRGFCYTPSLAKRLEKAIKDKLNRKRPPPKPVHGYCYTPSLAQRLAKAIENSIKRPIVRTKKVEDFEDMEEDKPENDSSVKEDEEMEQEEKSEEGEAEVDEE